MSKKKRPRFAPPQTQRRQLVLFGAHPLDGDPKTVTVPMYGMGKLIRQASKDLPMVKTEEKDARDS